jgi:hypothetical protein
MRLEIIEKVNGYERYLDDGVTLNLGAVDFQLRIYGMKDKETYERTMYALTEAIANTMNDFQKAYTLGRGY